MLKESLLQNIKSIKIVLLGESSVGKTSIVSQFVNKQFTDLQDSTIGAAYFSKLSMIKGENYRLEIWDTAGQERYHSLAPMYYRGAKGAIVVFDITSANSFEKAKSWISELKLTANMNVQITLVGNKSDLQHRRQVLSDSAKNYAEQEEITYIETSAKNNINIDDIFNETVSNIQEFSHPLVEDDTKLSLNNGTIVKRKCC